MGLLVENNMKVFQGKRIIAYSWNHGNEYTMTLEDKKGNHERVRIPSYMKDMFEQYFAITMQEDDDIEVIMEDEYYMEAGLA